MLGWLRRDRRERRLLALGLGGVLLLGLGVSPGVVLLLAGMVAAHALWRRWRGGLSGVEGAVAPTLDDEIRGSAEEWDRRHGGWEESAPEPREDDWIPPDPDGWKGGPPSPWDPGGAGLRSL